MDNKFHDLIYGPREVEAIILRKYPNAQINDASDDIHQERFECTIEGVSDDEFYPFAIREGFGTICFRIAILMQSLRFPPPKDKPNYHKETLAKLEAWIGEAKKGGN